MRAPGMSYMRMSMFCWTTLASNMLIVAAFPILTATLIMLALDRYLGFHFFTNHTCCRRSGSISHEVFFVLKIMNPLYKMLKNLHNQLIPNSFKVKKFYSEVSEKDIHQIPLLNKCLWQIPKKCLLYRILLQM